MICSRINNPFSRILFLGDRLFFGDRLVTDMAKTGLPFDKP